MIRPTLVAFPLCAAAIVLLRWPNRRGLGRSSMLLAASLAVVLPWLIHTARCSTR